MKLTLMAPVGTLSGTTESSYLVYYTRDGRTYARDKVDGKDAESADQVRIREYATAASQNWDTLTEAERAAWEAYATEYFSTNEDGKSVIVSGVLTYTKANVIRQVLGLPLITAAPVLPPPGRLIEIRQMGAQNPDSLGITVSHALASTTGLQLMVRMTAAMETVANRPQDSDYRYVRGVGPLSAVALPASGTDITFSPTRFVVNDGQRYGVQVRVVRTADGIMGRVTTGDFIKSV